MMISSSFCMAISPPRRFRLQDELCARRDRNVRGAKSEPHCPGTVHSTPDETEPASDRFRFSSCPHAVLATRSTSFHTEGGLIQSQREQRYLADERLIRDQREGWQSSAAASRISRRNNLIDITAHQPMTSLRFGEDSVNSNGANLVTIDDAEHGRLELLRRAKENAPELIRRIPDAIQLKPSFDVSRLVSDLAGLDTTTWKKLKFVTAAHENTELFEIDWRILPLRGIGGDPARTDSGMPGLEDYAYTNWMSRLNYIPDVLEAIPAPLRAVRLITLGPGTEQALHADPKVGFPWGFVRLHVPITIADGAVLRFEQSTHQWQPGTLWFGNFAKPHQVVHTGKGSRVHLIIDACVTPELMALFPEEAMAEIDDSEVLFHLEEKPLAVDLLLRHKCSFEIPFSFVANVITEPFGQFTRPQATRHAEVTVQNGRLVLSVDDGPRFGLVHLGQDEFRFVAWSQERTIRITPGQTGGRAVTLVERQGSQHLELNLKVR